MRLPDGRRGQRRFPASAPVAALYDYCLSQSEEAAAGRPFTLAQAFPGEALPSAGCSFLGFLILCNCTVRLQGRLLG